MDFVNIHGQLVHLAPATKRKRDPKPDESYHRGWKVVGIPPGAYEKAVAENQKQQQFDRTYGSEVRPDLPPYEQWANNFTPKPVRAKPYEVPEAAEVCAEIARKEGWQRVFVIELKHEAKKQA